MSILPGFGSNTIPTFLYEPFSYTISNPSPGTYTLTTSNTPGIPPGYLTNNGSNVIFATTSNGMNVGTEVFTVTASLGGTVIATSSNTVTIGAGRFLDASGASYAGRTFNFFKNEPITPIPLVAPFAIATPTTVPTLPPGLTYTSNASNTFTITGTPLATVPQSNYLAIGKATGANLGKIVTSQFGLSVSNERVVLNLSGTPIVSPMTIGTAISPRVITAQYPPYPSGGTLRYTWSGIPDGIQVTDGSGNTQSSPFTPSDISNTLIVQGTPSLAAANAYRDANISSNTVTFLATRTNPLPVISNSTALTFAFGETVLFDSVTVPSLYSGVTLDPSATSFRAQTYFSTGSAISNIFSPDLRSDLSINFVSAQARGYLTGTPSAAGTASYTIRAINSNNVTRDLSVPITVAADSVTFVSPPTPAVDICYNFVLSRPSSLALTGYYPSNIQFQAVAASGRPVNFSAPGLSGTGLSLSNVSANTVQLVGTPESVTPLSTITITADASGTPASASRTFKLEVLNDQITFSEPTPAQLSFIQNRTITPIQITATTLSERPVISFTSPNLPTGISISPTGLITGAPIASTGGTFTVIASTGFMSQSKVYTFTLSSDTILFFVQRPSYSYAVPASVSIPIDALTYSGDSVSNYAFSGFSPSYGLSIDSSTGVISGTLLSGIPPEHFYPTTPVSFNITANSGIVNGSLASTFTASNQVVSRSFLLTDGGITTQSTLANDDRTLLTWPTIRNIGGTSISLKNTSLDSNVFIIPNLLTYSRSTDGANWTDYNFLSTDTLYSVLNVSNTSQWYGVGTTDVVFEGNPLKVVAFFTSSNDGVSWSRSSPLVDIPPRNAVTGGSARNYLTTLGVAFGSNNGVLVVGGGSSASAYFPDSSTLRRSTDNGESWSSPTSGAFGEEVVNFELAGPVWVMAGSSGYSLGSGYATFISSAVTLRWSDDQGETWKNGTGAGTFNVSATQVVYAEGRWLAAGLSKDPIRDDVLRTGLSFSTDGKNWSAITLPSITFSQLNGSPMTLPEIGSIWFTDEKWYVLVKLQDTTATIFEHSLTGDLTTGWTKVANTIDDLTNVGNAYIYGFKSNLVRLGSPTTVTLAFNTTPVGGPTVTSPTQLSYIFYQYVPITPITFTATGTGTVYYFVISSELPTGLTFDPVTGTISGTSVVLGQKSFTVYAKDNVGVTAITISTNTILPVVTRQQTSAGAWTSLIRQYTVVNAAQNSVNGRVLPAGEATLGEFTRPEPPDSVSAPGDPNCVKKC